PPLLPDLLRPTDDTRRPGEPPCTPAGRSHAAAPTDTPRLPVGARGFRRDGRSSRDEGAASPRDRRAHLRLCAEVRGRAVPVGWNVASRRLRLFGLRRLCLPALRRHAAAPHLLAIRTRPA